MTKDSVNATSDADLNGRYRSVSGGESGASSPKILTSTDADGKFYIRVPWQRKGEKMVYHVPDEKSKTVIFWLEHEV